MSDQPLCAWCKTPFDRKHPSQRYCTPLCKKLMIRRKARILQKKYREAGKYMLHGADIPWNMAPDKDPYLTISAYTYGQNDIDCRPGDSNFNPVI